MIAPVLDKHIKITPGVAGGKPRIAGHRITVQTIVVWHEHLGKSADEISAGYGLSLADVYAALAYYFDHQDEMNQTIQEDETFIEERRKANVSALEQKLKSRLGE